MPSADYSSFHQPSGTVADGTKLDNFIDAVQATVNGIDKNNLAVAAGILASQLADPTTGKVLGSSGGACAAIVLPGSVMVSGTKTANVATAGTTFAGGADLLAAALSFTADGTSNYLVTVICASVTTGGSTNGCNAAINFDSAQNTLIMSTAFANGLPVQASGMIVAPSLGAHTVNVRVWSAGAWTITFTAGAGGAGVLTPILVTVSKL